MGTGVKPCGEDEPPTLDELQRFRNRNKGNDRYDGGEGDDENEGSKIAKSLLDELSDLQGKTSVGQESSNKAGLVIGDTVEIVEGDLVGMRGKLLSIDGSTVKVKPIDTNDLGDTTEVEFLINQVRKHIPVGAHVKVIDGRYANDTGVVVAVENLDGETDATAVILTDMTNKEVSGEIAFACIVFEDIEAHVFWYIILRYFIWHSSSLSLKSFVSCEYSSHITASGIC